MRGSKGDPGLPAVAVRLLPTPQVADKTGGHKHRSGSRSGELLLPGVVDVLLKTPTAQLAVNGGAQHPAKRRAGGHGPTLADQVEFELLPTPAARDYKSGQSNLLGINSRPLNEVVVNNWGDYTAAIRRWEVILGREAPSPTEVSVRGNAVLSPAFVEWMMGLPENHVTGVPGLSRSAQLKILGRGVVPQQAIAALHEMIDLI